MLSVEVIFSISNFFSASPPQRRGGSSTTTESRHVTDDCREQSPVTHRVHSHTIITTHAFMVISIDFMTSMFLRSQVVAEVAHVCLFALLNHALTSGKQWHHHRGI